MKKRNNYWFNISEFHGGIECGLDLALWENKSLEIEIGFWNEWWNYFTLDLCWSRNTDHAGPECYFGILGNTFRMKIYDHRHWNNKKNRWYKENEELDELLSEGTITRQEYDQYTKSNKQANDPRGIM